MGEGDQSAVIDDEVGPQLHALIVAEVVPLGCHTPPYDQHMTPSLLAVTADQVIAASAAAQTAGVLAGLVFAWRQVREAAATRRDQGRAYVAAFFELHPDRRFIPDLTIRNFGETAAYDVTIAIDPPLRSSFDDDMPLSEVGMLRDGIPTLPPGASVSTIFDSIIERPDDWELTYRAVVSYQDRTGERHDDEFTLDLAPHMGTHYIERKGVHDLHEQVKALVKEVQRMRSGFGGPMSVLVQDRNEYLEQRREEREVATRAFESRGRSQDEDPPDDEAKS